MSTGYIKDPLLRLAYFNLAMAQSQALLRRITETKPMTPPAAFLQAYTHATAGMTYSLTADGVLTTNCCIAVEETVMEWKRYELNDYDGRHSDFMILDGSRPYSPVEACITLRIADGSVGLGKWNRQTQEFPTMPGIYVCQGWDDDTVLDGDPLSDGHTFIIWVSDTGTDGAWIYEATNAKVRWARRIVLSDQFEKFDASVYWVRIND